MPLTRPVVLVLLAGVSLSHLALADTRAARGTKSLSLTPGGELSIRVPDSWRETRREDPRGVATVELRPAGTADFIVQVSAFRMREPRSPRTFVDSASRSAAPQSVEGKLAIESLCGRGDTGWYFSATDKAPKSGEYRDMTQGALVRGEFGVTFTVLSNGDAGHPKTLTLDALRELACRSPELPPASPAESQSLSDLQLTGAPWKLHLELSGFEVEERQRSKNGGEMIRGHNRGTGVILSAFVVPAPGSPSAEECLEHFWPAARSSPIDKVEVRRRSLGELAIGEYTIELDTDMRNKHVNAYLGADGGCVDVHLSKMPFRKGDDALFDEVLRGVTLR